MKRDTGIEGRNVVHEDHTGYLVARGRSTLTYRILGDRVAEYVAITIK